MTTYTADDFKNARFATHPDGRIAMRDASPSSFPWNSLDDCYTDDGMVEGGWVPVQECPKPDQHDDRYVSALAVSRVQEVQVRLEQAEQERDEANDTLAEYVKARVARDPLTAREHLDAAWEAAHVPEGETIPKGAWAIQREPGGQILTAYAEHDHVRAREPFAPQMERRLLDPPAPSRPEGAEELKHPVIVGLAGMDSTRVHGLTQEDIEGLCDRLAERGVRVTGAES